MESTLIGYVFEFWWMFPVAFCVCLMATSTSVEGAVFFAPIFLLAFPLFAGVRIIPIEAVFLALSIEIFGFLAHRVPAGVIMGLIGGLMIVLSGALFYAIFQGGIEAHDAAAAGNGPPARVDLTGRKYWYGCRHGPFGYAWSALGGVLVGFTGIGIGGLATSSLIIRSGLPVRVAVGTGVLIVFLTVLPATLVHGYVLSSGELNVHWNILFMTIPAVGVGVGGQVSPFINNRVDGEKMKVFLSAVFIFAGALLIRRAAGY